MLPSLLADYGRQCSRENIAKVEKITCMTKKKLKNAEKTVHV